MKKIRITQVGDAVRDFLLQALEGDGVEIEDEAGRICGQLLPHRDPTPDEERQANASLARLQKKADASMKKHGKAEADVMRVILEDD